jgi:glycosyltransferase involved in cell wall biosynthesis
VARIYYLAPDYDLPSWGIGLLYHHVRLLRALGFDAFVLHEKAPFRLSWLNVDVPIRYLDAGFLRAGFRPDPADILVVPEVRANSSVAASLPCRRAVFVQGGFLILNPFDRAMDYRDLGFEAAIAVLPHIRDIVAKHFGLSPAVVPPFVAPYFYVKTEELDAPRRRRILLAGKVDYRKAGYLDFDIARKVLERLVAGQPEWELTELAGLEHEEAAEMMKTSALLVNVNILESFNAIVPEAMAAGCVVFCYEAYGGRDFLRADSNAFVWPNNYVYPLLDRLCEVIETYDDRQQELAAMRRAAFETASQFSESRTSESLAAFFTPLAERR